LAARRNIAVIVVVHLNKSAGARAISGVSGSFEWTAASRAAFLVVDEVGTDRILFLPMAYNIGLAPEGLAFRIKTKKVDGIQAPRVVWENEPIKMSADEALAAANGRVSDPSAVDEVLEFVRKAIAGLAWVRSAELFELGKPPTESYSPGGCEAGLPAEKEGIWRFGLEHDRRGAEPQFRGIAKREVERSCKAPTSLWLPCRAVCKARSRRHDDCSASQPTQAASDRVTSDTTIPPGFVPWPRHSSDADAQLHPAYRAADQADHNTDRSAPPARAARHALAPIAVQAQLPSAMPLAATIVAEASTKKQLKKQLESASFFVLNATRRPAYHACFEGQHEFRESIAF
jgi:hypothetical protein